MNRCEEFNRLPPAAQDLVDRLAHEAAARRKTDDYVLAESVFLGLFPFLYGVLTFSYSKELWNPTGVHSTAMQVPGAPESWGAAFLALGLTFVFFSVRGMRWSTVVSAVCSALVLATFMLAVLMAQSAYPRTMGTAVIYLVFSLLFLNRARLAWVT